MSLHLGLLRVLPLDPNVARNQDCVGRIVSVFEVANVRGEEGVVEMRTSLARPQRHMYVAKRHYGESITLAPRLQ